MKPRTAFFAGAAALAILLLRDPKYRAGIPGTRTAPDVANAPQAQTTQAPTTTTGTPKQARGDAWEEHSKAGERIWEECDATVAEARRKRDAGEISQAEFNRISMEALKKCSDEDDAQTTAYWDQRRAHKPPGPAAAPAGSNP